MYETIHQGWVVRFGRFYCQRSSINFQQQSDEKWAVAKMVAGFSSNVRDKQDPKGWGFV
jgi:hypothetical protein